MNDVLFAILIAVPVAGLICWPILVVQARKKNTGKAKPEKANGPLYYTITKEGAPDVVESRVKVDLSREEWLEIRKGIRKTRLRVSLVSLLLGAVSFAVALSGDTYEHEIFRYALIVLGYTCVVGVFFPYKTGISREGEVVDRVRVEKNILNDRLRIACPITKGPHSIAFQKEPANPEEYEPVSPSVLTCPLSEIKTDEKTTGKSGKHPLAILIVLALDVGYFFLWRANVAGTMAGILGIVACVIAAGFLIRWAFAKAPAVRAFVLVMTLCFAVAGGMKVYSTYILLPDEIKKFDSWDQLLEKGEIDLDSIGKRDGLVAVRKGEHGTTSFIQLPLGGHFWEYRFFAEAVDKLSDTAGYGNFGHAVTSGYAYDCIVTVRDRDKGVIIGNFTIHKDLPEKTSQSSGSFTEKAGDGEIMKQVEEIIRDYKNN